MSVETDRMKLNALSEEDVISLLLPSQLVQAREHFEDGDVIEASVKDATVRALLEDDYMEPQVIEVSVRDGDLYTGCTCRSDRGGICEHIGAVLLTWVHEPESFVDLSDLDLPEEEGPDRGLFFMAPDYEDEYLKMLVHPTIRELREIAKARGIPIKGNRKDPIVEELAARLSDLGGIHDELNRIGGERTGDLLTQLAYLHLTLPPGYGLPMEQLVDEFHKRQKSRDRGLAHRQILDLNQRGLLLTFKQDSAAYYTLPLAVRACLPPRPGLIPLYSGEEIVQVRETSATQSTQAMYALWEHIAKRSLREHASPPRQQIEDQWPELLGWDHVPSEIKEIERRGAARRKQYYYSPYREPVTVPIPAYHLTSGDRKTLRRKTGCSDEEIELCYALLDRLGTLTGNPGKRISAHKEVFQQFLSLPPTAQMRVILGAWKTLDTWSEMDIVLRAHDDVRLRRSLAYTTYKPQDLYREWAHGRQAVLRFLSTLQENVWISLDGFLKTIYNTTPNLVHVLSDSAVWWFDSLKTKKQFGTTFDDWQQSNGRFAWAMLEGPLLWLGAVNLGYRGGQPVAFKLTPVGSFALDRRLALVDDDSQVAAQDAVQIRDNLTLTVIPSLVPAQLHDMLHLIGRLEKATPGRFVYRITAEGMLRALEQGQTIERITASLKELCGRDIPPAWQERFHTWSQNYGKLHVYESVTLIELADDFALQEIMINTSLREHLIYQFSPRLVAIRPDAVDTLVQEMEKRGYTPRVE